MLMTVLFYFVSVSPRYNRQIDQTKTIIQFSHYKYRKLRVSIVIYPLRVGFRKSDFEVYNGSRSFFACLFAKLRAIDSAVGARKDRPTFTCNGITIAVVYFTKSRQLNRKWNVVCKAFIRPTERGTTLNLSTQNHEKLTHPTCKNFRRVTFYCAFTLTSRTIICNEVSCVVTLFWIFL